jgi:hypothetical protein
MTPARPAKCSARPRYQRGKPLMQCDAAVLRQASLIVMVTPSRSTWWNFTDAVTKVLGACDRPVLFIPPLGDAK